MGTFRETSFRIPSLVLSAVCFVFLVLCASVPFLNASGTLVHLDGSAGVLDHSEIWDRLDFLSSFVYTIGDYGCHQEQARTLILNGNEMPMCVRDVFIILGFAIGFLFHGLREGSVLPSHLKNFLLGAVLVVLTLIEWSLEHYCGFDGMGVRMVVSVVSGFGATMMVQAIFAWENEVLARRANS